MSKDNRMQPAKDRALLLTLALFASAAASPASAALITFSDDDFNASDYVLTPTYKSDPNVDVNSLLSGAFLAVQTSREGTASWAAARGFVNTGFAYDPSSQGALLSIDASVEKFLLFASLDLNGYTGILGNSFRPLIEQGGQYYMATIAGTPLPGDPNGNAHFDTAGPSTISQNGLLAASFLSYDFTTGAFGIANPNFSGGLMRFGIGQVSSTGGLLFTDTTILSGYDNLELVLKTVSVPEPGTVALLAAGLLALGAARRRV
jgi:hypothetical protein